MPGQIAAAVSLPGQAAVPSPGGDTVQPGGAGTPTPMPFGQLIAALAASGTTAASGLAPAQTAPAATAAAAPSLRAKAALATLPARQRPLSPTSPSRQTAKPKPARQNTDVAPVASSTPAQAADPPPIPSVTGTPVMADHQPPAGSADKASATAQAVKLEAIPSGPAHPAQPDPAPAALADPSPPPAAAPATQPISMPIATPVAPALPASLPSTQATAPAQASAAKAPPPATQVAPVLLSLAHPPGGTQHLTIRLDPPELGAVQIRMQQSADAPARIEISVQRPETLDLMLRDQPSLQHTLDQAGVPAEGRHLVFQLDPQGQPDAGANTGGHGRGMPGASATGDPQDEQDEPAPAAQAAARWTRAGLDITA